MNKQNEEVFAFIVFYKQEHDGNSPSFLDIAQGCESVSNMIDVFDTLDRLEASGKIKQKSGGRWGIEVTGGRWEWYG